MIPAGGMAHSNRVHLPPLGDFSWVAGVHGTLSPCPELRGLRKDSRLLSPLTGGRGRKQKRKRVINFSRYVYKVVTVTHEMLKHLENISPLVFTSELSYSLPAKPCTYVMDI